MSSGNDTTMTAALMTPIFTHRTPATSTTSLVTPIISHSQTSTSEFPTFSLDNLASPNPLCALGTSPPREERRGETDSGGGELTLRAALQAAGLTSGIPPVSLGANLTSVPMRRLTFKEGVTEKPQTQCASSPASTQANIPVHDLTMTSEAVASFGDCLAVPATDSAPSSRSASPVGMRQPLTQMCCKQCGLVGETEASTRLCSACLHSKSATAVDKAAANRKRSAEHQDDGTVGRH